MVVLFLFKKKMFKRNKLLVLLKTLKTFKAVLFNKLNVEAMKSNRCVVLLSKICFCR